jgi:hypothetical protein
MKNDSPTRAQPRSKSKNYQTPTSSSKAKSVTKPMLESKASLKVLPEVEADQEPVEDGPKRPDT